MTRMTLEGRVAFAMQHADCCDECVARAKQAAQADVPDCICPKVFYEGLRLAYVNGCPVHGVVTHPASGDHPFTPEKPRP